MATSTFEPSPGSSAQRYSVSHGNSGTRPEYESGRRQSLYQVPPMRQEHSPPDAVNYQYARGFVDDSRSRTGAISASGPHRSPDTAVPFPSSRSESLYSHPTAAQARPPVDYFGSSSSSDRYALPSDQSRRSSVVSQQGFAPQHQGDPSRGGYPPSRLAHYSLPMRDESTIPKEHAHYIDRDRLQPAGIYNKMQGYHDTQPTFFMPSHYDYPQGKTRKRSNLPKQSTEIMKTWFDQVRIEQARTRGLKGNR